MDFNDVIRQPEYKFLMNNANLGSNIMLLGVGGSHAYGTNGENSDVDLRGIATNTSRNILTGNDFEQVVETETDTTIYSLDKIVKLLCSCNPNVIELLGLKPEHYIVLNDAGKELLSNKHLFLSKRAVNSFGGYANAQLRRLENKSARLVSQTQMEKHILKSIEHASVDFKRKFFAMPDDAISLYVDKAENPDLDSEIFMDISISHYPLRDYKGMMTTIGEIVKAYNKIGHRNANAISRDKLGKHMCHLIRLYLMCFDILERGEIVTYREKEHDLLMDIRKGKYLDDNRQPISIFYDMVDEYEKKLDYLKTHTDLPDEPDMDKVNDLLSGINYSVVCGGRA